MNTKHTPEPWKHNEEQIIGDTLLIALCHHGYKANAARIVACVNACAGMDDPAKEIATLRDRIAELEQPTANGGKKTVVEYLMELPDGYRERALEQYDPEFAKRAYEAWGSPRNTSEAIQRFSDWKKTDEKEDFWLAVYDHYHVGTPLPPLPI
jgi:hypothetical protein